MKPKIPKLPPGPKPWPIVGNLPEMLASKSPTEWIHKTMEEFNTDIACIRLGNVHVIPVTCPTIAREFLRKYDADFASRPISMATDIISNGHLTTILVPLGEQWKKMKKIIANDLFSPLRNQWLQDKRNEEADNLMFYVYNKCSNGELVNVRIATQHYCGNVYRKMFFNTRYFGNGMKDGGPGVEEKEHVDAVFVLLNHVYAFSASDYIPWLRLFDLDGHKGMVKDALKIMNKYHDSLIEERIKQWNDGSKNIEEDLLDVLISLKDINNNSLLTIKEIKAQIIGSHVLLGRTGLGRNPKVWTEPYKFQPERHLKNDGYDISLTEPNLKFISFSTGRRGCPGVKLGTTMTILLLARLLHGFTWSAPPDISKINLVESKGVMFLDEPLRIVARPRLKRDLYRDRVSLQSLNHTFM
ncbi:hypothetical protein KIW84_054243 [Lathyrus oleraceus]|uniref:Cytochrome P450 n=1 Tax=Pisum sativum TaxID=3888 RepID=A0A9D4WX65_PEA|nr:hypothetical protein KIW84_054243 [Pisum sativum]